MQPSTAMAAPTITSPGNGAHVGAALIVHGMAQPGSIVLVTAQPRLLGQAVREQTSADASGRWEIALNLQAFPMVSFPYVISAVEIANGAQSDASSIEVTVQ